MTQEEFFSRYTYSPRTDKLGGGAFGTVYKAYDNVLNKYVALKVAEVKTIGDKEFSLKDEFRAVQDLADHPNIASYDKIYTFEQPNGLYDYALIQYYKDGNLSNLVEKQGLSFEQKEDIAVQILQGLQFLHNHNVVHRDMKPSNVLIHRHDISGRYIPKIADFGLSKKIDLTGRSRLANSFGGGTLKYSSPEQLKGEPIKHNTDLWAWAVMTVELLTGKYPFDVPNVNTTSFDYENKLYDNILNNDLSADISGLPQKWQQVLRMCLEKDVAKRSSDIGALLSILNVPQPHSSAAKTQILPGNKTQVVAVPQPSPQPKQQPLPEPVMEATPTPLTSAPVAPAPSKKNNWLWFLLIPVILAAGYFGFKNYGKTETSESKKIAPSEARALYQKVHDIQISGDFSRLYEVYTDPMERHFNLENPSLDKVISELKDYRVKWQETKMDILSFQETAPNEYEYHISYSVRKVETGKIFDYDIRGKIKYKDTDTGYRIYSISDLKTDRNNQDFTYTTSVFKEAGSSGNGYTLDFNSEILIFEDLKNELVLDYLYKDVLPGAGFANWTKANFKEAQKQQFHAELNDLAEEEPIQSDSTSAAMYNYISSTNMTLKSIDQNFFCVEVFYDSYTGGAHGMQTVNYKNIDYKNNNIVSLSTIMDTQKVPWNTLLRNCLSNFSKDSGGASFSETDLFEPEKLTFTDNFYFDNQSLYMVYNPYEIAAYAYGIIEIRIPFSEIDEYMNDDFKQKIKESKKINLKKK